MIKQTIITLLIITIVPFAVHAQFGKLSNKVKSKVDQRVDRHVDQAIDKTLDKAEGKETASTPSPAKTNTQAGQTASSASTVETPLKSFSKYDFIAGEQIIYYDNFDQEVIAELPAAWNTNGSGEVVTLNNLPGKWLRMHKPFIYLTSNQKEFGENYTVEFDLLLQLKNNGWMFPEFSFNLMSTNGEPSTSNNFLKETKKYASVVTTITPGEGNSRLKLDSYADNRDWFRSEAKALNNLHTYWGKTIHVAMQVQKERFRVWINEEKAFDVPKGVPLSYKMNQLAFNVGHTNYTEETYGVYISNIKVATGKADTRHKLIDEGKFSTTAILFDVNAATIKPESAAAIREIALVLQEHKEVKIKIIGHTDNDGDNASNLTLSQKRADAVKETLVSEYGINENSIEPTGKGESNPVADNKSREGKAANRRVEFIKL